MKAGRIEAIPFAERNGKTKFNASGVAQVGPDRFVFTDNRDPTALFELVLSPDGTQREPVRRRPISGLSPGALSDPEGLARVDTDDGIDLIVASSLAIRKDAGSKKAVGHDGLVRVHYTPNGELAGEAMTGFRDWLLQQHPELAPAADLDADKGGLNIEGIGWDPSRSTLVFGVRSPVTNGRIPVLSVVLDRSAPWTTAALHANPGRAIHPANSTVTQGIRDISHDSESGGFLVLLGRSTSGTDAPFQLCRWDGISPSVELLDVSFRTSMKPEGVIAYNCDGGRRILVVGDSGSFATVTLG